MIGTRRVRESGFTMVEVVAAISVLTVSLTGLGIFAVSTSKHREEIFARTAVLLQAQTLMETVVGSAPGTITSYDGTTYSVAGVEGANMDGSALTITVTTTAPKLLDVSIDGSWLVGGTPHDLTIESEVYDPAG